VVSIRTVDVVVLGGHGKIALRLLKLLAERGDRARGLIRKPEQAADLEAVGGEPVICDIEAEDDISEHVRGADAVVFAAGAGPGSGPERKQTMDLGGALKLIDAAKANGISRYVIVSSIGADNPGGGSGPMGPYLQAKHDADVAVEQSGLDFTIVRPGSLTDDTGTSLVTATTSMGGRGSVPRDDVAATLFAVLQMNSTIGKTFELFQGETPIEEALRAL
jgi:uncharacterized protein YbjT (DUF2867 family)